MYTPKHFQITDHQEIIAFIKRFSFGMLVTVENGLPIASHIPFTIREQDDKLILSAHVALANSQHKTFNNNKVMVIFTEPHAYVSPSHYETELSVPTWNYLAVHAYGTANIIEDQGSKLKMLEDMIRFYNDPEYLKKWEVMPMDYKLKMSKGIVAFDIIVEDLQGKKKLSQNRTETERANIINSFEKSSDINEREIAAYIKGSA